jgi:uncharacterized membrane protein
MNAAIATARGDGELLMRSVGRYFAALLVSIAVSGGLSFLLAPPSATGLMVETSLVSRVAVLLPLAAGAAGALNLCQAERSSLVSGAATGVLIAASLAPQSALVGLALPLGDWSMVRSAMLVLLLQLTGINASGALVFRLCGLTPQGVRYTRGRGWKALATGAVTLAALGALLAWQFADHAQFERLSIEQRASASAEAAAASIQGARPVSVHADFTQRSRRGQDTLLAVLHVQRAKRAAASSEAMECEIIEAVSQKLRAEFQVIPLVAVHFVSTH